MKKSPSYPLGSGSSALSKVSSHDTARHHSDSEPEHEDYVAVPEFRASMQDAITKALENIVIEKKGGTNGQKKKKNKGKVLFATHGMGSFN